VKILQKVSGGYFLDPHCSSSESNGIVVYKQQVGLLVS